MAFETRSIAAETDDLLRRLDAAYEAYTTTEAGRDPESTSPLGDRLLARIIRIEGALDNLALTECGARDAYAN